MATVKEHYAQVLSEIYSWMYGGFASGIEKGRQFYSAHQLEPRLSGTAVDLGAGCGFQAIPLAEAGFTVTAIEQDELLLGELQKNTGNLPIRAILGDLLDFKRYCPEPVELITCMTDTVILLESEAVVSQLFQDIYNALLSGGMFLVSYRDLSTELYDLDRFLPVRSDKNLVLTCFLEYEPKTVKVHDIIYKRNETEWELIKGFYRKLRISRDWTARQLASAGFSKVDVELDRGFVTFICQK